MKTPDDDQQSKAHGNEIWFPFSTKWISKEKNLPRYLNKYIICVCVQGKYLLISRKDILVFHI